VDEFKHAQETLREIHRWAIEVDQDQQRPNLKAQRLFIRDFGKWLYDSIDDPVEPLRLEYPYFTRIFEPRRDKKGAYVRLHFFAEEADYDSVECKLDKELEKLKRNGKVFQVTKERINAIEEAARHVAQDHRELYYRYMHHISRIAVQLFELERDDTVVNEICWNWTHNFFNLLRGHPVYVLELPPGTKVRRI